MQIDFHHTVTYVIARAAEFNHQEAEIIAYSAQYVDDATNSGLVQFYLGSIDKPKLGPTYTRVSSAHKMLDYRNNNELANSNVWLPFHFLPSNDEYQQENTWTAGEPFLPRLICRPNSPIAQLMVKNCIKSLGEQEVADLQSVSYRKALSRLGISMHVYADTWAHQDFAGVAHQFNELSDIKSSGHGLDDNRVRNIGSGWWTKLKSKATGGVMPLGHGPALTYPDLPFLTWKYQRPEQWRCYSRSLQFDNEGYVTRNNIEVFIEAAQHMYTAMCAFRQADSSVDLNQPQKMPDEYTQKIKVAFLEHTSTRASERHDEWEKKINGGYFPFEMKGDALHYDSEEKQWKSEILKGERVSNLGAPLNTAWNASKKFLSGVLPEVIQLEYSVAYQYPENNAFLSSQWKLFHDALMEHRYSVCHDIFPEFNICAS